MADSTLAAGDAPPVNTRRYFPPAPEHVPAGLIHEFDIYRFSPGVNDPLEQWGNLLASDAPRIFYTHHNGGHWVFLDYEDVREGFRNDTLFSTFQTPIPPIEPYPVMQPQGVDPPDHKTFRSLLAPLFTPVAVEKMRRELQQRSNALLDAFADRGSCEFGRDFASLLPTGMFLYLMGMPEDRLMEFVHLAEVFMRSNDEAERATNIQQIYTVIGEYLAWRSTRLGDDLGSVLVKARDENGQPQTTNYGEYLLPLATEMPRIEIVHMESPSPRNPIGVKGAGEGGTIPAAACVISAIEDALSPFNVHLASHPVSPQDLVQLVDQG